MRGFFRMEGPLFEGLSRMADLVILNIIFLLCCLPVVTVGAALTGLSYVMLKIRDKEEGYVVRSFFHSFKQNFKQATILWLLMLAALAVIYVDFRMLSIMNGTMAVIMQFMLFIALFIWLIILIYAFPLLARFENTIRQTAMNAILLALANAPKTILMIVVTGGAVVLTLLNTNTFAYGLLAWMLIGFSLISWINAAFLAPMFRKLMPTEEDEDEEAEDETAEDETAEAEKAEAVEDETAGEENTTKEEEL